MVLATSAEDVRDAFFVENTTPADTVWAAVGVASLAAEVVGDANDVELSSLLDVLMAGRELSLLNVGLPLAA